MILAFSQSSSVGRQFLRLTLQFPVLTTQLNLRHHLPAQNLQIFLLLWRQLARPSVGNVQGAEAKSLRRYERCSCIKPELGIADDERIICETLVVRGGGNDEQPGLENCVTAKGDVACCFTEEQAERGFEPLPIFINQRDQCNGGFVRARRQCAFR